MYILYVGKKQSVILKERRQEYQYMDIEYRSTRNSRISVTASQAILQGLSTDGGLFVPDHIPPLPVPPAELAGLSYQETALLIMKQFLTDFTEEELKECITNAYDEKFDTPEIAPLALKDEAWYLELFHGKTIAFKDMALSILPYLMTTAARKNHVTNEIVILTATSGDTGKAALAGFADVPGTRIIVFYPKHGVSHIQELQMITQAGENTCVIGIEGNFDDAQNGVKALFSDEELRETLREHGFQFSSANSINIGRLIPQIVYYVYGYARLLHDGELTDGEKINIAVPTGNFGNILAAYYAGQMGLPVDKLICASNENKVLFDFFSTGRYDRNRPFVLTSSPSMDILISSNLERLLYHKLGEDPDLTAAFMKQLSSNGSYEVSHEVKRQMSDFWGDYASEEETLEEIKIIYDLTGYVIDPHTAVASMVYRKYVQDTNDKTKTIIASTASPYKFPHAVMKALGQDAASEDDFELSEKLSLLSGTKIPAAIEELRSAPVRHKRVAAPSEMKQCILSYLAQ